MTDTHRNTDHATPTITLGDVGTVLELIKYTMKGKQTAHVAKTLRRWSETHLSDTVVQLRGDAEQRRYCAAMAYFAERLEADQ